MVRSRGGDVVKLEGARGVTTLSRGFSAKGRCNRVRRVSAVLLRLTHSITIARMVSGRGDGMCLTQT